MVAMGVRDADRSQLATPQPCLEPLHLGAFSTIKEKDVPFALDGDGSRGTLKRRQRSAAAKYCDVEHIKPMVLLPLQHSSGTDVDRPSLTGKAGDRVKYVTEGPLRYAREHHHSNS